MLRIIRFNNRSTTEVQIQFSEDLNPNIGISNVAIYSSTPGKAGLTVRSVRVKKSVLTVVTNQQIPLNLYYIDLVSVPEQPFSSKDGKEIQDNDSRFYFIGQERENSIRDNIINSITDLYDLDQDTFVRRYISCISDVLIKADADIKETGNANFLSESITDEFKTRGYHPNDRLGNEGAYNVLRVSKNPEGSYVTKSLSFLPSRATTLVGASSTSKVNTQVTGFPSDPFSLRSVEVQKEIVSNAENKINKFDGTLLTLSKSNISLLSSAKLIKSDGTEYVYDLTKYGYSIHDNRHDTVYGRKLLSLDSNQIKLSDLSVIAGDFSTPVGQDRLEVSYFYRNDAMDVLSDDLSVSIVKGVVRETIYPFLKAFSLKNFPIVFANDSEPTLSGVSFLDPNSLTPFSKTHPAFATEIPFSLSQMPSSVGQYSVNYSTGQVFVYGASANDGTGERPPVATYYYRKIFEDGIDYNFNSESDEIVAVPSRDLVGEHVKLKYRVEEILAEGVDWVNESHVEAKNEYVESRFLNQLQLHTKHYPITSVFEILNETTGEQYSVSRFSDNYIYFNGRELPRFITRLNEQASFKRASGEVLYVTDELAFDEGKVVFKVNLSHSNVLSYTGNKLASNVNTSLVMSESSLFLREFFYDAVLQSLSQNLDKMSEVGDYIVDYANGVIYLVVSDSQSYDLGSATYLFGTIQTDFSQILSVDGVRYRKTIKSEDTFDLGIGSSDSESIVVTGFPSSVERSYNGDYNQIITLGSVQSGVAGQTSPGSYAFTASDGNFTESFADGYHILRTGDTDRTIVGVSSSKVLIVDGTFTELDRSLPWTIVDYNLTDDYGLVVSKNISHINGIYSVSELQTLDKGSLTNYYNPGVDTFSDNRIELNNDLISTLPAGTALAVDYSYGNVYVDYTYVKDVLRVSYEYGDNSIGFTGTDAISPGDNYFVSYKYGALRNKLLQNFGSLTNISDLVNFPVDFDRELYRDFLIGTLQAFVNGATVQSLKTLVNSVTKIDPEIKELTFDEWTAGRDNLHLSEGILEGPETYRDGRFESGIYISDSNTLTYPEESYVSYRYGTFEAWVSNDWSGIDNDAQLTIETSLPPEQIFIGASAFSPEESTFTISRYDLDPFNVSGRPVNYRDVPGMYIWFDDNSNLWNLQSTTDAYGVITSTGEINNVGDGYSIRSGISYLEFDGYNDGQSGEYDPEDGYAVRFSTYFSSDDLHYLMDAGPSLSHNRMSIFKDGSGNLNFRIYDDSARLKPSRARLYNVSCDIRDWAAGESHMVAASWRLNTSEGIDEMHLFIDGQEVSNKIKFGGKTVSSEVSLYGSVAREELTFSSPKLIVGDIDGVSIAGSSTFYSESINFESIGIVAGDELTILDPTNDGITSPYNILSVSENFLVLESGLTLSLVGIKFSINRAAYEVSTNVDLEDFIIISDDGYGNAVELKGLYAEKPDYSVSRTAGKNYIHINNGISEGALVYINTLGLKQGRSIDAIYLHEDGYNALSSRGLEPSSLENFEAYKVIIKRTSIISDGYIIGADGVFSFEDPSVFGLFSDLPQPSNNVNGKSLTVTIGGISNVDFGGTNYIKIFGDTYSGASSETITVTEYGPITTSEFFKTIDSIEISLTPINPEEAVASIDITEAVPFTQIENNGEYAQISSYENGIFRFIRFGSGNVPYELEGECYYILDYPTSLNIPMKKKGNLNIGSSIDGKYQWNGVIDQVCFLSDMLDDIRIGESKSGTRTITADYNSNQPLKMTPQTLMLINFDGKIDNVNRLYKNFDERFVTSSQSVNSSFGDCAVFINEPGYVIDNGNSIFNNNKGSIEFWVCPLLDSVGDRNVDRYYFDVSSYRVVGVKSSAALTVVLPNKAKRILSVKLPNSDFSDKDYFSGGKLLLDGKTVVLGARLPNVETGVEITYVPADFNGDRVSIYKDSSGYINFSIIANQELFKISHQANWMRNTWHRIQATWETNTIDNKDSMRLFVDGIEGGTVTWGTSGLLYGDGIVYGQAAAGTAGSAKLVSNIDLLDTFSDIYIGNSISSSNSAAAKMDNIRFSNAVRNPIYSSGQDIDINYSSNLASTLPVIEDSLTTLLLNFNQIGDETYFLSNLVSQYTPLFQFDVIIDDSFKVLSSDKYKALLKDLVDRMKPGHTRVLTSYVG